MQQALQTILDTVNRVYPLPFYLIFTAAAIFYVLLSKKKEGAKLLGLYSACILILFFLPPFAYLASPFLRGGDVYWRFLWLLPSTVVIAYAAVLLVSRSSKLAVNLLVGAVLCAALVLGGKNLYASGAFEKAPSREKVAADTLIAAHVIEENIAATGHEYAYLAAPFQISHEIREVSSAVKIYSKRHLDQNYLKENYPARYYNVQVLNGARTDDKHKMIKNLRKRRCNYILVPSSAGCDEDLVTYGYEKIYQGGEWNLWYNPNVLSKKEKKKLKELQKQQEKEREDGSEATAVNGDI